MQSRTPQAIKDVMGSIVSIIAAMVTVVFQANFGLLAQAPSKAAITQDSQKPSAQRTNSSGIEKALVALNNQGIGTIELRLHEVVQGRPNIVRLRAGTKSFLFDPVSRIVVFRMLTSAGRSVDLHLPLGKPAADGRDFIALVWDMLEGG
jgi:hypothetical protein